MTPPKPGAVMQQMSWRQFVIREEKKREIRDHAARQKDAARDKLAADLAAYLERGGRIAEAQPRETVPGRPPVRAMERSW